MIKHLEDWIHVWNWEHIKLKLCFISCSVAIKQNIEALPEELLGVHSGWPTSDLQWISLISINIMMMVRSLCTAGR